MLPPATFTTGLLVGVMLSAALAAAAGAWAFRKFVLLERRARRAERLAELGMLTGGLAHEIKNPLSTLQLNLQLLREDLDDRAAALAEGGEADAGDAGPRLTAIGRMTRRADSLSREAGRLREILDDFLRYAGRIEVAAEPTDLAALAEDLADFLAPQAQAGRVRLATDLRPTTARVDPRLVKQALLNLVLNAVQHTPAGGTVTLGVAGDRGQVRLWVADTGPGVDPAEHRKVFDPYFTRRRGGTGLGLALTRRIAEAHGGRVTLDSEPGRGATFALVLPERARAEVPAG